MPTRTKRIEIPPGTSIAEACADACAKSLKYHCAIVFDFNGIDLTAYPSDLASKVESNYFYAMRSQQRKSSEIRELTERIDLMELELDLIKDAEAIRRTNQNIAKNLAKSLSRLEPSSHEYHHVKELAQGRISKTGS